MVERKRGENGTPHAWVVGEGGRAEMPDVGCSSSSHCLIYLIFFREEFSYLCDMLANAVKWKALIHLFIDANARV